MSKQWKNMALYIAGIAIASTLAKVVGRYAFSLGFLSGALLFGMYINLEARRKNKSVPPQSHPIG